MKDTPIVKRLAQATWPIFLMTALFALALVVLVYLSIDTLSSRDWCAQIMAAERFTGAKTITDPETVRLVIGSCTRLLSEQLASVGIVAKILAGALALSVVAMYLVRFAGAQASGSVAGNSFDIRGVDAPETKAAKRVAGAAVEEAKEVQTESTLQHPQIDPTERDRI